MRASARSCQPDGDHRRAGCGNANDVDAGGGGELGRLRPTARQTRGGVGPEAPPAERDTASRPDVRRPEAFERCGRRLARDPDGHGPGMRHRVVDQHDADAPVLCFRGPGPERARPSRRGRPQQMRSRWRRLTEQPHPVVLGCDVCVPSRARLRCREELGVGPIKRVDVHPVDTGVDQAEESVGRPQRRGKGLRDLVMRATRDGVHLRIANL